MRCPAQESAERDVSNAALDATRERDEARARLAAIGVLLSEAGCDCQCAVPGHRETEHDAACGVCVARRIEALL